MTQHALVSGGLDVVAEWSASTGLDVSGSGQPNTDSEFVRKSFDAIAGHHYLLTWSSTGGFSLALGEKVEYSLRVQNTIYAVGQFNTESAAYRPAGSLHDFPLSLTASYTAPTTQQVTAQVIFHTKERWRDWLASRCEHRFLVIDMGPT